MNEEQFIEKNISIWQKLETYHQKLSKKNIVDLTEKDLNEFCELSRVAAHHLAYCRTHYKNSKTTLYLNQLNGISHNYFYSNEKFVFSEVVEYFKYKFPQMVRENMKYCIASFAIFLAGAIFIFILGALDNQYLYYFLPENILDNLNVGKELSNETWSYPILSSFIMTNNIIVSIKVFAYGFLAGLGTIYVLFYNGLNIGAFVCLITVNQLDMLSFLSLILPHGFIELTAIFISGGAGLIIGKSVVIPNDLTRKDALIFGAKKASGFIPGIVVMLVLAGLIEGFFTPLNINEIIKLVFAAITFALLFVYFRFCGKNTKQ